MVMQPRRRRCAWALPNHTSRHSLYAFLYDSFPLQSDDAAGREVDRKESNPTQYPQTNEFPAVRGQFYDALTADTRMLRNEVKRVIVYVCIMRCRWCIGGRKNRGN